VCSCPTQGVLSSAPASPSVEATPHAHSAVRASVTLHSAAVEASFLAQAEFPLRVVALHVVEPRPLRGWRQRDLSIAAHAGAVLVRAMARWHVAMQETLLLLLPALQQRVPHAHPRPTASVAVAQLLSHMQRCQMATLLCRVSVLLPPLASFASSEVRGAGRHGVDHEPPNPMQLGIRVGGLGGGVAAFRCPVPTCRRVCQQINRLSSARVHWPDGPGALLSVGELGSADSVVSLDRLSNGKFVSSICLYTHCTLHALRCIHVATWPRLAQ
jgi:hypothetical protein